MTKDKTIKHGDLCVSAPDASAGATIQLAFCDENSSSQKWQRTHRDSMLKHVSSGLCIDSADHKSKKALTLNTCDTASLTQQWKFTLNRL